MSSTRRTALRASLVTLLTSAAIGAVSAVQEQPPDDPRSEGTKRMAARLAKLKSAEFYRRGDVIATGGFATMPDRKEADDAVAAQCAAALEDVKLPAGAKK